MNCSVNIPSSVIAVLIAVDGDLDFTAFKKVVNTLNATCHISGVVLCTPYRYAPLKWLNKRNSLLSAQNKPVALYSGLSWGSTFLRKAIEQLLLNLNLQR